MSFDVRSDKARTQRQVMIQEAIKLGSFDDRKHVKQWLKQEFNLKQPVEEVSTEYSLTDNQLKLFYIWLRYFTGRGPRPTQHRARARVSKRQLWRIEQYKKQLGWDSERLVKFIKKQCRLDKTKMPGSLSHNEGTKVITGMERIYQEQPFKRKRELELDEE